MTKVKTFSFRQLFYEKLPTRSHIAIMMFFSMFFSYMMRGNISMTIIAMVNPTGNSSNIELPDYGPRYNWTAYEQSLILGGFFWRYAIIMIPSGVISEWYGGKRVLSASIIICILLSVLTPIVASASFWLSFLVRLFIGIFAGTVYPVAHNLISLWAPPDEKGKFLASLMGNSIGTVATWPLMGIIIENLGWVYAFYITGSLTAIFAILWLFLVFDSPAQHPWISPKERTYIENEIEGRTAKTKVWPPYCKMLCSLSFWSLAILHYGNLWGLYFLLTAAPKFISEVLGFNMSKTGVLAALPYLARFVASIGFGQLGDVLRRKKTLTPTQTRKWFCLTSHVIPGLLLIGLNYVNQDPLYCILLITLSLGFNGSAVLTNLQNSQDLAPNFAATIYSMVNTIGTSAGFATPLVVAYFTKNNNTINEWYWIFVIGGVAYIIPAIIFIFGSAEIQAWNEIKGESKTSAENYIQNKEDTETRTT